MSTSAAAGEASGKVRTIEPRSPHAAQHGHFFCHRTFAALLANSDFVFGLPRGNPHDVDGVADNVGGVLLAFRASGHFFLTS